MKLDPTRKGKKTQNLASDKINSFQKKPIYDCDNNFEKIIIVAASIIFVR